MRPKHANRQTLKHTFTHRQTDRRDTSGSYSPGLARLAELIDGVVEGERLLPLLLLAADRWVHGTRALAVGEALVPAGRHIRQL